MYFGPGIYHETCEEFWHGRLWAESPLFGQSKIYTAKGDFICYYTSDHNVKYGRIRSFIMVKDILKIQIQQLLTFHEIPS